MADDGPCSLAERLRAGDSVDDDELDGLLPPWLARLSPLHWTPIAVAKSAATFLVGDRGPSARVLDVGAGVGKLCAVGAATTTGTFVGIERRAALVAAGRDLARAVGVDRASLRCGAMEDLDWAGFTGLYFYNPFGEQFLDACERIEQVADCGGWAKYVHLVRTALAKLYLLPTGTRVATYHGLGAPMPPGYSLVDARRFPFGVLHCYERVDPLCAPVPSKLAADLATLFDDATDEVLT